MKQKDPTQYVHPWTVDELYEQALIDGKGTATYSDKVGVDPDTGEDLYEANDAKFADAIIKLVVTREATEATKSEQSPRGGWTVGEVLHTLVPTLPGADGRAIETLSLNERGAWDRAVRRVNQVCNGGVNSALQAYLRKQPAQNGAGRAFLVKTTLFRDFNEVAGFYITRDQALLKKEALEVRLEKFLKDAESMASYLTAINAAQPALGAATLEALESSEARLNQKLAALRATVAPKAVGAGKGAATAAGTAPAGTEKP